MIHRRPFGTALLPILEVGNLTLTQLRIQNFKSWRDTGQMRFAPLTGFLGPNSSGKTSILQFLLMLKQTVLSTDSAQVLNMGQDYDYVNLGSFTNIIFQHQHPGEIAFEVIIQNQEMVAAPHLLLMT